MAEEIAHPDGRAKWALRRTVDADPLPAPELDLSRGRAPPLHDVRDPAEMDVDARPSAGLRVPDGELGGPLEHRRRQRGELLRVADDDVTARDAAADVQPEILPVGDGERQLVVLRIATADEQLPAVDDRGSVRLSLARHGADS